MAGPCGSSPPKGQDFDLPSGSRFITLMLAPAQLRGCRQRPGVWRMLGQTSTAVTINRICLTELVQKSFKAAINQPQSNPSWVWTLGQAPAASLHRRSEEQGLDMTHSSFQRHLPAWPGGWGSAWGGLDRSTAATVKSVMCMEEGMCPCRRNAPSPGKSLERRWCKMRLSTGDFSVGFTRVLHDG